MRYSGSICFGLAARRKVSARTGHRARSHIKNGMLRNITVPRFMKHFLRIFAIAVCGLAGTTFADDFKSMVIPADGMAHALPRVHGDQFMVIRNFTQEDGTISGLVSVTKPPSSLTPVNVLSAAILDPSASPEVINSIVIAGPADVSVTCGASVGKNCFISFKKDSN